MNETSLFQNNLSDKFRQHEIKPIVKAIEHSTFSVDLDQTSFQTRCDKGILPTESVFPVGSVMTPCHLATKTEFLPDGPKAQIRQGWMVIHCTELYDVQCCIIEIFGCMCLQILDEVPWLPHCCLQTCSWCIGNQSPSLNLFSHLRHRAAS